MTANVSTSLNKWDFCETHVACLLALIHSCSSNLQSELYVSHAKTSLPTALPLQERQFPTPLRHAEKLQLHWNWAILPLQSSLLQPPKFNVDNPR